MIITRTPFRISFVGGGSDLSSFYSRSQGAVLSSSINKYMYISSHRFFDEDKIRVKYSQTETVTDIKDLHHPIVREVVKQFDIAGAMEISSNADIPSGTGLGSSSSFTVGLLHNMYTVFGQFVTKERLADEACRIEIEKLNEPIGKQDQYAASFGGLNVIKFNTSGSVSVEPIHLQKEVYKQLQNNLLVFYMGQQRKTASILDEQKSNMQQEDKYANLMKMVELVWKLREALYRGNLDEFGRLLHVNWLLKKQLASKITNPNLESVYETALQNGALGGKLLGAGGGGFFLFYCEQKDHAKLRKALSSFREMNFSFENEGSKVIYVGDEYNE